MTGLGSDSVHTIPVTPTLQMDLSSLQKQITEDRENGYFPFLVIGTAGTTGAGTIDDLSEIHLIASKENLWFHVDAAYGGGIIISDKYKSILDGIEKSDSVTLDLHKWFSVPMGGSLFVTNNRNVLFDSFKINTPYMPEDGDPNYVVDPYLHSVQWSRRFIGLKAYLPLVIHGWKGYEQLFDHQMELGRYFRKNITELGWNVINQTELPVICFTHREGQIDMNELVNKINQSGKAWMSIYPVFGSQTARVCFNNYNTGKKEVDELIALITKYSN